MEWPAKKENANFPVCFTVLKCTSNIPPSKYYIQKRVAFWSLEVGTMSEQERSLVSWWCGLNEKWPTGSRVWTLGSDLLVLSGEVAWLLECRALLEEVHHWDIVLRVHSLLLFFCWPFQLPVCQQNVINQIPALATFSVVTDSPCGTVSTNKLFYDLLLVMVLYQNNTK